MKMQYLDEVVQMSLDTRLETLSEEVKKLLAMADKSMQSSGGLDFESQPKMQHAFCGLPNCKGHGGDED